MGKLLRQRIVPEDTSAAQQPRGDTRSPEEDYELSKGEGDTSDRAIFSSSGIWDAMRDAASFCVDPSRAMRRCSCRSGEHATVMRLAA